MLLKHLKHSEALRGSDATWIMHASAHPDFSIIEDAQGSIKAIPLSNRVWDKPQLTLKKKKLLLSASSGGKT